MGMFRAHDPGTFRATWPARRRGAPELLSLKFRAARAPPRGSTDLPKESLKTPNEANPNRSHYGPSRLGLEGPRVSLVFSGGIPTVAASSRLTLRRRMRRLVMMILPSFPLFPCPNTACTPISATVLPAGAVKTSLLPPGSRERPPGEHCVCPVLRLGSIRWRELRSVAQ